jgi:hypothetical protein
MACDTRLKPRQTLSERAKEVREAVGRISAGLITGKVTVKVSPQGAIAFGGLTEAERDGVTDACAYRRLLTSGSALALAKVKQAEMLAGRSVDKQVIASGVHSHDGGETWHHGH